MFLYHCDCEHICHTRKTSSIWRPRRSQDTDPWLWAGNSAPANSSFIHVKKSRPSLETEVTTWISLYLHSVTRWCMSFVTFGFLFVRYAAAKTNAYMADVIPVLISPHKLLTGSVRRSLLSEHFFFFFGTKPSLYRLLSHLWCLLQFFFLVSQ